MSELSAADKAERRAKALARLEETKRKLATRNKPSQPSSASAATVSSRASIPTPSAHGQAETKSIQSQSRNAEKTQKSQSTKSGLFAKPYIEFDFSTMEDSKGGYMVDEHDESVDRAKQNAEWLESLSNQQPPYDFSDPRAPSCHECGTKDLDFRLWRVFGTRVCKDCRRKIPEKYSLLTKTECKADYLLTESELRDKELLPHLERPNPYQQTYSNMMLFLRYQVEEFAWKKWGGPEQLDAEWEKRQRVKKDRKQAKFDAKLREMRNKTRAQAITKIGRPEKHVHIWGRPERKGNGTQERMCGGCGLKRTEVSLD